MSGTIVILNGVPRSGKTSIAAAIQDSFEGVWVNLGVDAHQAMTPRRYRPGIGLRPGGERPDLEAVISAMYAALWESVAAHSRRGLPGSPMSASTTATRRRWGSSPRRGEGWRG